MEGTSAGLTMQPAGMHDAAQRQKRDQVSFAGQHPKDYSGPCRRESPQP